MSRIGLTDLLKDVQASRGSFINADKLFPSRSSQRFRDNGRSSETSSRPLSGKSRLSGQSVCHSTEQSLPRESLSQPTTTRRRSIRSRTFFSQTEDPPSSSYDIGTPAQLELTGSTTIADGILPEVQRIAVGGDVHPSDVSGRSLLNQTPLQQVAGMAAMPPTSGRSKRSLESVPSSFQAAQRMDDLDLDNTIQSITQSVLAPWDVDSAMRMPLNASAG